MSSLEPLYAPRLIVRGNVAWPVQSSRQYLPPGSSIGTGRDQGRGIEVRITERNGTASYGNFAYADGGSTLVYSLPARGGGTRVRILTTNVCKDASGANSQGCVWQPGRSAARISGKYCVFNTAIFGLTDRPVPHRSLRLC
jgi:hypothetical protein